MKLQRGFTLVELLVVIVIISVLASVIMISLNGSRAENRDAQRKTDLRTLQGAVELYKQKNGRYPEGCKMTAALQTNNNAWLATDPDLYWSGQVGTRFECPGASREYIIGLAPEFIPFLPTDPRLNGNDSGYVYITNPEGTVYKIMAYNTVEADSVTTGAESLGTPTHPMVRCGEMTTLNSECATVPQPTGGGTLNVPHCSNNIDYRNDYAVFGGFAPGGWAGFYRTTDQARRSFSETIRCR